MSTFAEIFGGFIAAHQRLACSLYEPRHSAAGEQRENVSARQTARLAKQRGIERSLLDYFRSHRIRVIDVAGEAHVDVVRHHLEDEPVVTRLSLEKLAAYLAQESA
jgi:hypothetical protein